MITKLKHFLLTVVLSMAFTTCDKQTPMPYVFVDFEINVYGEYNQLQQTFYPVIFDDEGYRGIIIYKDFTDEYVALENTCTHDPRETCSRLIINPDNNMELMDTCCGSRFTILQAGEPSQGPAKYSLKQYQTSFNSASGFLRIYN